MSPSIFRIRIGVGSVPVIWMGLAFSVIVVACGGGEDGVTEDRVQASVELNVAVVANPQMEDIADLTPELFTAGTGIAVNYTILEEQELREVTTMDVAIGGNEFDVVMVGVYEAPQFGQNGWLKDLQPYAESDADYDLEDLIPAVRGGLSFEGGLYASPFYAESSFMMYREDLLAAAGQTMPAAPTWDEVAAIARAVDTEETAGICLRGKPSWGDLGASFTTVLNTFGGTWWDANEDGSIGPARVDQPEFADALNFYVDLLADAGEDDAENASFNECLDLYQAGKVAMWYDATSAAGELEADDSPVRGKNGYALAPVKNTAASGWLWAWSLAIPETTAEVDAAWEFVSWATSAQYIEAAGERLPGGWAAVPPGTRRSTYENPKYIAAASEFSQMTLDAILAAPIDNPGTTRRPGLPGVQYVGVPEFQAVGDQCTELFANAIAGSMTVGDALANCQVIASEVSTT